jgi:hypothetical protein
MHQPNKEPQNKGTPSQQQLGHGAEHASHGLRQQTGSGTGQAGQRSHQLGHHHHGYTAKKPGESAHPTKVPAAASEDKSDSDEAPSDSEAVGAGAGAGAPYGSFFAAPRTLEAAAAAQSLQTPLAATQPYVMSQRDELAATNGIPQKMRRQMTRKETATQSVLALLDTTYKARRQLQHQFVPEKVSVADLREKLTVAHDELKAFIQELTTYTLQSNDEEALKDLRGLNNRIDSALVKIGQLEAVQANIARQPSSFSSTRATQGSEPHDSSELDPTPEQMLKEVLDKLGIREEDVHSQKTVEQIQQLWNQYCGPAAAAEAPAAGSSCQM